MPTKDFFDQVSKSMQEEGIDFKTEEDIQEQINIQNKETLEREKEKKQKLLDITKQVESRIKIKVISLSDEQLRIDKENIVDDMDRTMILHSHIIDDVFDLQKSLEEIKVIQNSYIS